MASALEQLRAHRMERWTDLAARDALLAQAYRDGETDVASLAHCTGLSLDHTYVRLARHGIAAGRSGRKVRDYGEAAFRIGDTVYHGDQPQLGVITDQMFRRGPAPGWQYGIDWYDQRNTQVWYEEQELTNADG